MTKSLRELAQLRETIDSLEMVQDVVAYPWAKEIVKVRRDYHKLLYREKTGREYKSEEELRRAIDRSLI